MPPTIDASSRPMIRASWSRMRRIGMRPDGAPEIAPLAGAELQHRRENSALAPVLPELRRHLLPAGEGCKQAMVITDGQGRVLWREGGSAVSRFADRLGFVDGSHWTEPNVGTNAIGTALVLGQPVQIHAGEHYVESHTAWTCAAAPVLDPVDGEALGVVDLSGPAHTAHVHTLSLVAMAARLVSMQLAHEHESMLAELRAQAAPLLAKVGGRALVVSQNGSTAAVTGCTAPRRVVLPQDLAGGPVWLPSLGAAVAEPLPGGWLLRLCEDDDPASSAATRVTLELTVRRPVVRVEGPSGSWTHHPSPRHAQILGALARHRAGRTAAELADELFCDRTRTVTVRAELSRLRRTLGPLLLARPYRFADGVHIDLAP